MMRYYAVLLAACILWSADTFPPAEVAILGDIDYGRTSEPLDCSAKQKFCAVLFNGTSGDRVEAAVTGGENKPFVAIADGSLRELDRGEGQVAVTLPEVQDGFATYYIVFQDRDGKPGKFTVQLNKRNP